MGRDDKELLTFAARWAPFGGPPADEVFLKFGMSPRRFRIRVGEAAARLQTERQDRLARTGHPL